MPRSSSTTFTTLIVATHADPDVVEYPETGKVAAVVQGEHRVHRTVDAVPHAGPEAEEAQAPGA